MASSHEHLGWLESRLSLVIDLREMLVVETSADSRSASFRIDGSSILI